MEVRERVVVVRVRKSVHIFLETVWTHVGAIDYGINSLHQEIVHTERKKDSHIVFIDLEKFSQPKSHNRLWWNPTMILRKPTHEPLFSYPFQIL